MTEIRGKLGSVEEFLAQCEVSGDAAYGAFRFLLELLEDANTRTGARNFLSQLHRRIVTSDQCLQRYHFQIQDILLDQYQGCRGRKKLTMMVIPSIFIPEDWSFTFYEGLSRHPDSMFKDKTVAELGCGNGWISIAIAEKWLPSKVYGLDINPRAVKISWINLYLNALDENGQLIYDAEKKTLLDRVEFHESDLIAYCKDHAIQLERIVGCIPQILNPNPDAMAKFVTENASEEFLYSLSNYCALQGFVEDQFGLGLIARAVEEGMEVITPMGIMIFNMGGRPGQAVCKRLFERRGFYVNKLWQTKVIQASDTDISALVEIEKNSPHRFEFFMGINGDQPIGARTAWAYGKAGGSISHALSVYSCQLRHSAQVKNIFDFMKNFHEVSSSLDLSFEDDSVADEKISFLSYLASELKGHSCFPFEPAAGSLVFRNLIANFLRTYHHIPLTFDNIVIFPSRAVAIENSLRLFSPYLAIVDEHLSGCLPQQWLTSLKIGCTKNDDSSADLVTVIEAPRQSDLMAELIKKLKPKMVITGMSRFEAVTSTAFIHLLNVTEEIGSLLFLDISDHFELSSLPSSNGVLKYLAETPLPSHCAIICSLVKNRVYSDLEVAFVISEEDVIHRALSKTVEVLEGYTEPMKQYYYGCLFHELLSFQLADRHPAAEREFERRKPSDIIGFANSAMSVFQNSELSINEAERPLIHMDVDQNLLPTPSLVKAAVFESFARQNLTDTEVDVTPCIKQFVKQSYGLATDSTTEFVYADSSQAIFNKLLLCCIQEGGTICFPAGTNGCYVSAAKFLRANIRSIPTANETGFKLTEAILVDELESVKKPWVYISGPTISPTGLLYSNEEIESILRTCARFGARVVIDTSFSGLEDSSVGGRNNGWDLEAILSKFKCCENPSFCLSLLGGLSLNILSGALKFGCLILSDPFLVDMFHGFSGLAEPHSTVKYAVKKLLGLFDQNPRLLLDVSEEQTRMLKCRFRRLIKTLGDCGWDVVEPRGGISMVAKPVAYLNSAGFQSATPPVCPNADDAGDSDIRQVIMRSTGLCVNSSLWTGIPGYCRFSVALEEGQFQQALDCIRQFHCLISN